MLIQKNFKNLENNRIILREFKKWAPNMNTIIYIGDQASRSVIQDHEWKMPNGAIKFNAVVTSYEIILKDEGEASSKLFKNFSKTFFSL